MYIDEWGEVALTAQQRRRRKLRCVGDSCLFIVTHSVVATRVYREDLPRVTTSHNRLGLSLSKHIRHRLVVKINGKRKPQTYEALGHTLAKHSYTRHAPAPITSPRHAMPCHVPAQPDDCGKGGIVTKERRVSSFLREKLQMPMALARLACRMARCPIQQRGPNNR
jgi:hypothetical protein